LADAQGRVEAAEQRLGDAKLDLNAARDRLHKVGYDDPA
jgi:hypothetical protein